MTNSVGIVETKHITFSGSHDELLLESGQKLGGITIAYETYGKLTEKKDNAILVLHAFSGDAHAAGFHKDDDKPGWWDAMIGPSKAFDTAKYFVICTNVIGGCMGSTGPSSIDPATNKPYGLNFPIITIADMVNAQKKVVDSFGIKKLLSVAGGSMGGMQVLQWFALYPDFVASAIPIAATMKHSPQQIAFNEVGRQSVMGDVAWSNGHYYEGTPPERGLAVARMIGHITYMSDKSMQEKFSRKLKDENYSFSFKNDFEIEGYLRYRGDSFVKRFDANSYLYITKAMDYFDVSGDKLMAFGNKTGARFLIISFTSDWLYPPYQSKEIVQYLSARQVDVTYCEIASSYGHDSFLVEIDDQSKLIKHFLNKTYLLLSGEK